jgi:hypothetical protein
MDKIMFGDNLNLLENRLRARGLQKRRSQFQFEETVKSALKDLSPIIMPPERKKKECVE